MNRILSHGHFYGEIVKSRELPGFVLTETRYPPGVKLPPHAHEHGYLCLIRRGVYTETYGKRTRTCRPLTLAFHPPGEVHSERFQNLEGRSFNIEFKPEWLARVRAHSQVVDRAAEFHGGCLAMMATRLYREFEDMDEVSPLAIEGLILELVTEASRRDTKRPEQKPPGWLQYAREVLHERFAQSLTLSEVADAAGVHPGYLANMFRRHYQCSVGEYMRRLRVESTRHAVVRSEAPLADIALAAGFSDQSHFSRTFKQITGMTPVEYRRWHRRS